MDNELLSCSVCYNKYNAVDRKPWDLGCGHCFCEACVRTSTSSFRNCPECRRRSNNPHVSISLLRLVTAAGSDASNVQSQQPQQQARASGRGGASTAPGGTSAHPSTPNALSMAFIMELLYKAMGYAVSSGYVEQAEVDKIAEVKNTARSYIAPVLGMLYVLSPLDVIPDFIPLIGWLDDGLVLLYVVYLVSQIWHRALPQEQQRQQQQQQQSTRARR